MQKPRLLKETEIEVRIQSINEGKGQNEGKVYATLLLYKDARTDQDILDEWVGPENWQRDHKEVHGNLFCGVGINAKNLVDGDIWVWKWDAGEESNQSAQKGHASDSFKRACVNWGIGRELYSAPRVFIELQSNEYSDWQGKKKANYNASFRVSRIAYNETLRTIDKLEIKDKTGKVRYANTREWDT